ncbi:MAG: hypothetical protein LBT68_07415 [Spirochaetales bacterium]|jgi:uncharacterized cysteine cluster protein YcgN (CxxCxxCC family)|nr:hypothetical protein [Spirochaetales bacterium]
MLKTALRVFAEYKKYRKDWDSLCSRCGLCCHERSLARSGEVAVDLSSPCVYLDTESRMCSVYKERFRKCPDCQSVNLFRALFHRYLPPSCAYARTFRVWKKP